MVSDKLSFECAAMEENAIDGVFTNLLIKPLINGYELHPGKKYYFDAATVLSQDVTTGKFDPFTCSCGTPECAGIWEKVELLSSEKLISWKFPQDTFEGELNADLLNGRKDLEFNFDIRQYKSSLIRLAVMISNMEKVHGMVNFHPGHIYSIDELASPVFARIERDRQHTARYFEHARRQELLFGEFVGANVMVKFPNGAIVGLSVEDMVTIANIESDPNTIKRQERLVAAIAAVRESPNSLIGATRAMSWDTVWNRCWLESSGNVDEDALGAIKDVLAPLYDSAEITLEYFGKASGLIAI